MNSLLIIAVLACIAAASSNGTLCVVSDGGALSLLQTVDMTTGHLALVANISNLGGVAGGHVLHRTKSGGFALITLNSSMSSDENYFYHISPSGVALAKFSTPDLIYSVEMDGDDALISINRDGRIWISKLTAPKYDRLQDQVQLLADNIMEFNALGVSAFGAKTFFVPIWDLETNMCHMTSWTVGASSATYVNSTEFCNVVALEYLTAGGKLVALMQQGAEVSVQILEPPMWSASVTIPLGEISNLSGASLLTQSVFSLVSGNADGSQYELINVDLNTKGVTRAPLGNNMIVALADAQ
jgi:hypothetical protein